jgi:hypothetical protein
MYSNAHPPLIPVLVTGIQCAQVLGRGKLFVQKGQVIHGADAPWLDSCDEHRNEGRREEDGRCKGAGQDHRARRNAVNHPQAIDPDGRTRHSCIMYDKDNFC